MRMNKLIRFREVLLALVLMAVMVGTSSANGPIVFNLTAGETTVTMPDCTQVTMWGFGLDGGPITVPGPLLEVPPGIGGVTITLTNNLPVPISLMINGWKMPTPNNGPVWTDGLTDTVVSTGSRPAGNYTARVRSFTHETAANGGMATYIWPAADIKNGTFLYTSSTNPAFQVHAGLYGAVEADFAAGQAYNHASTAYDKELILIFSEVDPVIQEAVAAGDFGPGKTITSMIDYEPKHFLINGKSWPDLTLNPVNDPTVINTGDDVLIRLLNAGLHTHIPIFQSTDMDGYVTLLAQDGILDKYRTQRRYSVDLPTGKTVDVMFAPSAEGSLAIYDRRFRLTEANTFPAMGMLAFLAVGAYTPPTPDAAGPTTSGLAFVPNPSDGADSATISATADDTASGGSNIAAAEWYVDPDPGTGMGTPLDAFDSSFNSPAEVLTGTISVSGWPPGDYTVYVRSQDASCNWGASVFNVLTVASVKEPVYRFWSPIFFSHFYTISEAEKNATMANPDWISEGVAWYAFSTQVPDTLPVYRFWSPAFFSHFYTISEAEKNVVLTNPDWIFEGVAWYAFPTQVPDTLPVYRFWSPVFFSHFYTISEAEKNIVLANPDWIFEGAAWYAFPNP